MMLCCKTQQKLLLIQIFVKKKFYALDKLILSNEFATLDWESLKRFSIMKAAATEGPRVSDSALAMQALAEDPFVRASNQSEA
jgi:hypothetical protein